MSNSQIPLSEQQMRFICKDNDIAFMFMCLLCKIGELMDDLCDEDLTFVERSNKHTELLSTTMSLCSNPFYTMHQQTLRIMVECINVKWHLSNINALHKKKASAQVAFSWKHGFLDVFIYIGMLCGGTAHAIDCAQIVLDTVENETFEEWQQEMLKYV